MTETEAVAPDTVEQEHTFGDAAKELFSAWVIVWLVWQFVLDEPFAPTLKWLLNSPLSALLAPALAFYLPLFIVGLLVRRVLGKLGWWQAHRFAIIATLILSSFFIYGLWLWKGA